jgi:release factor glutamine methyltransferase
MAHSSDDIGFDHWKPYYELLQRRYRGEPIQYITGETEFYGLPFRVTPDVLIPRPETELLVEKVLASAASFQAPRIVDVGAGSGAIAVALAHHLPCAAITAIDLSPAALTIARQNAALNAVSSRIRFLKGDLLAPVAHEQFEIVVSNPPYVPTTDRPTLSVEVRDHEPALALFAGPDGLDIYRRLIPQAFAALVPGGFLALEIGFAQSPAIADLLASSGFHQIEFLPDLQSIPRVALAQRP